MSGPQFVPSGQYISGPIMPVTHFVQPAPRPVILSQPRTVFTAPISNGVTYAAPNVRLAGPPIRPTVVRRTITIEPAPIVRAERVMAEPANCPSGTSLQSDGTCLERAVSYTAPVISQPYTPPQMAECPAGTSKQSDGTCLEGSYGSSNYGSSTYSASSRVTLPGTMSPAFGSSSVQSSSSTYSSSTMAGGYESYSPAPSVTTTYREPAVTHHVPDTVVRAQDEYCYAGGTKRYDSLGKEIKANSHDHCRHH